VPECFEAFNQAMGRANGVGPAGPASVQATTRPAGNGRAAPRAGNPWLRRALCEGAWAASKSKGTYLQAQFRRLAALRGPKRALIAVANSILNTA
jgi:hypothetical protein